MGSDPELENRRGLEWLVTARNKCQTLMFHLLERRETLPTFRRQAGSCLCILAVAGRIPSC